jgi:hypothetical protein
MMCIPCSLLWMSPRPVWWGYGTRAWCFLQLPASSVRELSADNDEISAWLPIKFITQIGLNHVRNPTWSDQGVMSSSYRTVSSLECASNTPQICLFLSLFRSRFQPLTEGKRSAYIHGDLVWLVDARTIAWWWMDGWMDKPNGWMDASCDHQSSNKRMHV